MIKEKDIIWAKEQLQLKAQELQRLPKKDDFEEVTRSRIKAFLGPWPRALEAAGLKEVKPKAKKPKRTAKARVKRAYVPKKLPEEQDGGSQ